MGKRRKRHTPHAEGEHGPRTEAQIVAQLQSGPPELPLEARLAHDRLSAAYHGKRRLVEDRTQSDEAEKNSEHKRIFDNLRRGENDGPADNSHKLHGVLGTREHRADNKERGPDGLPTKGRP
jgi:hypothetical protein